MWVKPSAQGVQGRTAMPFSAGEDVRLMVRVTQGDRRAFEALYKGFHPRLSRFLTNLVRRPQIVEEVLNDTMLVVWSRAETYNHTSKVSTWIFAIAYRKAMNALRRQDIPIEDTQADHRPSDDLRADDGLEQQQLQLQLMKAISELSADHRAVVDLTYFQDMNYRDIALIVECPVDTVKTRMFHARRHLKRALARQAAHWL